MKALNVAYYVTPHGLGHATRALEVIRVLMRRGHAVVLSSGATVGLFFQSQLANEEKLRFTFRTAVFDSGALQPHAFTVDMQASLKEYYQRADGDHREGRIKVRRSLDLLQGMPAVLNRTRNTKHVLMPSASFNGVFCTRYELCAMCTSTSRDCQRTVHRIPHPRWHDCRVRSLGFSVIVLTW